MGPFCTCINPIEPENNIQLRSLISSKRQVIFRVGTPATLGASAHIWYLDISGGVAHFPPLHEWNKQNRRN